jgi:hypothetical protein
LSPNKTLYIRDDDVPTWESAEAVAKRASQPLSQLIVRLLRDHVEQLPAVDDEITVEMRDKHGEHHWEEGFRGRWLIEPEDTNRYGPEAGACYGIALTAKGKIAVYIYHVNDRWAPELRVYDGLDEAQADLQLAPEAIVIAASEMGQRRVIRRDI